MDYKEHFKQQLVESIMEDTFAERQASHGDDDAIEKAKYFKRLMAWIENRRAEKALEREASKGVYTSSLKRLGRDPWFTDKEAREAFASNPRVQAMSIAHMGNAPDGRANSFVDPIEAGVEKPDIQKIAQTEAEGYGRRRRAERAEAKRRAKFTI